MKTLKEINGMVRAGSSDAECLAGLDSIIASQPDNDEAYLLRGMLYWRMGRRAPAINDLNAAVRINPASEASTMLSSIYSILNFYDKDRYNP